MDSISARHTSSAQGVVSACGGTYYSAKTLDEVEKLLPSFLESSNDVRVLEVFTDSY